MDPTLYDVVIVGGGPAAVGAAVYIARKRLNALLVTDSFGGQSKLSSHIQNWIGEVDISGRNLAKKLETHVKSYSDVLEIKTSEKVIEVRRVDNFQIKTAKGGIYQSKTVIIASGARSKKLDVLGEDKFTDKGVSYCSLCDAPLFQEKKVIVVGAGNRGLEAARDLLQFASEVYLLDMSEEIQGDPATYEEIKKDSKFKGVILSAKITEIVGEKTVTGVKYKDTKSMEEKFLEVSGLFIEIGSSPNFEIVKDLVNLNDHNEIIVDSKYTTTSCPGLFAAGDVTDEPYKQNNIAVGEGVKSALAVYEYLRNNKGSV